MKPKTVLEKNVSLLTWKLQILATLGLIFKQCREVQEVKMKPLNFFERNTNEIDVLQSNKCLHWAQ